MPSDAKTYSFEELPAIDYDAHPAYGRVLSMPMPGARLKAISIFGYGLMLSTALRMIDVEHLPRPADAGNRALGILRSLPTYLRLIMLQRLGRFAAGRAFAPKTARGIAVFEPLQRDGFTTVTFGPDAIAEIRKALASAFRAREGKLAVAGDPDSARVSLDPATSADTFNWFNQAAADLGLIEAASAYLKRPVGISRIAAEVVDAQPASNPFADVSAETSPCDGFGIDTACNVLKMVVYLDNVGAANGPLTYVAGSNKAARGFWDGLLRRANDLCGLSSTAAADRETFYALPAGLQRKASFGADLVADNKYTAEILKDQVAVTSNLGNAVLYDPAGIHRDAAVTQGRRTAAIVTFTELPR